MRNKSGVVTPTDAAPALTDDELSVVVGGTTHVCSHGRTQAHSYQDHGKQLDCPGPVPPGGYQCG